MSIYDMVSAQVKSMYSKQLEGKDQVVEDLAGPRADNIAYLTF